jgi:hypothetical protein
MTITLEAIEAEQTKLADMIAAFKTQAEAKTKFVFPETEIWLYPGEEYAGRIIGKDGDPGYHLVLLPGDAEDIKWKDAIAWAKDQGGELPTRREQSLLFANLQEHFKGAWYWSAQEYEPNTESAWFQFFTYGGQSTNHKDGELRARAVRRLPI